MIYKLDNYDACVNLLVSIVRGFEVPTPQTVVFDLDASMDPYDAPCSIYQCRDCDVTTHYHLGEPIHEECPRCGEYGDGIMELAVEVDMVVQGEYVVYRREE
jgi:tRNA G26 N,N-dimethylase Trm1